ncbi:MAG: DUF3291 domain-containing protein [Colwellia sp.]|nr:DUF3291 domain-containing protein [Colwellia sp.]
MYLAQLNIAQTLAPIEDVLMKEFVDNLEPINQLAEQSQGFIWRLQDEAGDATHIRIFDDPSIIANMSVWQDVESLKAFIFKTHHINFLKRKREWFEKMPEENHVMWWVEEGHTPTLEEAKERLIHLRQHADSPFAFSFKKCFDAI